MLVGVLKTAGAQIANFISGKHKGSDMSIVRNSEGISLYEKFERIMDDQHKQKEMNKRQEVMNKKLLKELSSIKASKKKLDEKLVGWDKKMKASQKKISKLEASYDGVMNAVVNLPFRQLIEKTSKRLWAEYKQTYADELIDEKGNPKVWKAFFAYVETLLNNKPIYWSILTGNEYTYHSSGIHNKIDKQLLADMIQRHSNPMVREQYAAMFRDSFAKDIINP